MIVQELVGGQTRTLIVGPCLGEEGMVQGGSRVERANDAKGGPVTRRGKRAASRGSLSMCECSVMPGEKGLIPGVAMSQDTDFAAL